MRVQIGLTAWMVIAGLLLNTAPSFACRPSQDADWFKSPQDNLKKYDFVFLGEIISVRTKPVQPKLGWWDRFKIRIGLSSPPTPTIPSFGKGGKFKILKIYKGNHPDKHILYQTATHSCGFNQPKGSIILLFVNKNSDDRLSLNAITPSRRFQNRQTAIIEADELLAVQ